MNNRCMTQLDVLKEEVESYIWTFRWLWILNIGAMIYGALYRNYVLIGFAAASALIAILGIARTRHGRKMVQRAEKVCLPGEDSNSSIQ